MALSKDEHNEILRRIMETGGISESMGNDIKALQDDFDEREGMLAKYNESYDGENTELEEKEDFESKYNELYNEYMNRFFGRAEAIETQEEDIAEHEDMKEEDEEEEKEESKDIEDLLG